MTVTEQVAADAITAPSDAVPRDITWRDLAWITWRHQRALIVTSVLVAAATSVTLVTFAAMLHHYNGCVNTQVDGVAHCYIYYRVTANNMADVLRALVFLPALAGAFWGAPLVTREVESGTMGLALGQDVSLRRWFVGKVTTCGGLLVLLAVAVSLASSVAKSTANGTSNTFAGDGFDTKVFETGPPVFTGYTVLAFAIGVAIGAIVQRTLPSVALAGAGFFGAWHVLREIRSAWTPAHSTYASRAAWWSEFAEAGICAAAAALVLFVAYVVLLTRRATS